MSTVAANRVAPSTSQVGRPDDTVGPRPTTAATVDNRYLLAWMFRFLRPVKGLVVKAAGWLTAVVAVDLLSTVVVAKIVDYIQRLATAPAAAQAVVAGGFWRWATGPTTGTLRHMAGTLTLLVCLQAAFRYLREVANMRR